MATSRRSRPTTTTQSTFSWEAPHARGSASLDDEEAFATTALTWRSNILAWLTACGPAGWPGRTSPAHSQPGTKMIPRPSQAKTLPLFSPPSSDGTSPSPPAAGRPVEYWLPGLSMAPTGWRGESLTLSLPEHASSLGPSHNDGAVCSLSDILETGDHLRPYFLTPRACLGILRRAAKRGKELPALLLRALRAVAGSEPTSISTAASTRPPPEKPWVTLRCRACGETFKDPYATGIGTLAPAECPLCGEETALDPVKK